MLSKATRDEKLNKEIEMEARKEEECFFLFLPVLFK